MHKNFFALPTRNLGFAAAGALLIGLAASLPAAAAPPQAYGTTQYNDEIVVTAPYTVQRHVTGRTAAGIPTETLSVDRHVYYGDLNLARTTDAAEFQQRIALAAKDACDQLSKLYPEALYTPVPSDQHCDQTAIHDAMNQYNTIMASAASTPQTTTVTTVQDTVSRDVAQAQRAAQRAARSAAEAEASAKAAQRAVEMASMNSNRMSGSSQRSK